jgi:hypothetical protein
MGHGDKICNFKTVNIQKQAFLGMNRTGKCTNDTCKAWIESIFQNGGKV